MKTPQRTVATDTPNPRETAAGTEKADYLRYEFSKGYMPLENPKSSETDETDVRQPPRFP